jgi:DNA-binding TFAR19-related protein (PDSD5 family)
LLVEAKNLTKLERLDLAYNRLDDEHGELLLAALEGGALPALREVVLDNRLAAGAMENWMLDMMAGNRISQQLAAQVRKALERR